MPRLPSTSAERELLGRRINELSKAQKADSTLLRFYDDGGSYSPREFRVTTELLQPNELYRESVMSDGLADILPLLRDRVHQLPTTSAGRAYQPHTARIGIISDLFLYKSFVGLADFVPITPDNYAEHLDSLDVLLVVSSWRGIDNVSWVGLGGNSPTRRVLLDEIIPQCKAKDIPVVFYSKEDPPNYERFVTISKHCDHIFTSAEEMIPRYQRDAPDAKSYNVLPFGVNPLSHSPIGSRMFPSSTAFFAGSWFTKKYSERAKWGSRILDGIVASKDYELVVFDRNSTLDNSKYIFPLRYSPYLYDAVNHDFLLGLQRSTDVVVNLNSVTASQTMYANRAVELQASGTLIISNYNQGLNSHFPHIHIANSTSDVRRMLDGLTFEELRRVQSAGIRAAFDSELALYRIDKILNVAGIFEQRPSLSARVILEDADDRLRDQFAKQSFGALEVIDSADASNDLPAVDVTLRVSKNFDYGYDYVKDLVNAFKYVDADVVQKLPGSLEIEDKASHLFSDAVREEHGAAYWTGAGNRTETMAAQTAVRGSNASPTSVYSVDAFDFAPRGAENISVSAGQGTPPQLSVVVPVYNNGNHLRFKCFASLKRSSMFKDMEIILVDDGSSDLGTLNTIEDLARTYPNVRTYHFPTGGSGSASRPRNKGLELATAPFVTYLDPDNEAVENGFARLWKLLQGNDANFAIGNMSIWREGFRIARYSHFLKSTMKSDGEFHYPTQKTLVDLEFRAMSIQALVARTEWLRGLKLEQPVGAVGQDSYFFQQMLFYATKIKVLDRTIHTYYSSVESSTVNAVSVKYFRKYLPLEIARSEWLREVGLMDAYRDLKLEQFLSQWYLAKLNKVAPEHREEAEQVIAELSRLYGDYQWTDPAVLEFWERINAAEKAEKQGEESTDEH
ncbi:glycosyltransferase family 2 protein [Neomicrococcus aestuarii]|uniref:Glycosyltransferase 2-like domain-containing protein n=1 Tax=Neomicrococcus aestuarii TaxID=556325 RepID=A0A1L2ZKR2_9MICC|nr:glycosyltransferase family 2 protein [Neomicrococcus aestuarii]APF39944.1 hypothetical protein BHE16_01690 [Neomicrococcus aestuarii]